MKRIIKILLFLLPIIYLIFWANYNDLNIYGGNECTESSFIKPGDKFTVKYPSNLAKSKALYISYHY